MSDHDRTATTTAGFVHLRAAIFDWAGTLIDYGSNAPIGALIDAFQEFGVAVSVEEARRPMGMAKRDHIQAILAQPTVAKAWTDRHGAHAGDESIDAIYRTFLPRNFAVAVEHSGLIDGAAEAVARLRAAGLKIGTTTGYTREIMAEIIPAVERQGLVVDALGCAGDTAQGRPAPLMIWRILSEFGVWPATRVVKIDDTPVGIQEGLNAGAWTVGVAVSGNAFGCSKAEIAAMSAKDYADRRQQAIASLHESGAHFVIDSVADLLPVMHEIDKRADQGSALNPLGPSAPAGFRAEP